MSQHLRPDGNLPPPQKFHTFFFHNDFKHLFGLAAFQFILGEEKHTHAIFSFTADMNLGLPADLCKKTVRNLSQYANAVPGFAFCILPGAVLQLFHDF